jgi:hypothetical protein
MPPRKNGKKRSLQLHPAASDNPRAVAANDRAGKSEPDRLNAAFSAKAAVHAWAKGFARSGQVRDHCQLDPPPGRIMSEQIRRNYPEEYRNSHAAA